MNVPGKKTYWLETYGCQMNKAESGFLEFELQHRGWSPAESADQAETVILNTCSVRRTAEDRIWGRLGFFKSEKGRHPFRLVLMGCMSERLKERILDEAPHVDLLVGNFQKHRLVDLLDRGDASSASGRGSRAQPGAHLVEAGEYRFGERHSRTGFQAYVPIMHGCDNFCTYCIVPYVRGSEVSRTPESIIREIRSLQDPEGSGRVPARTPAREITLLGQNVNSYRYNPQGGALLTFPGLLRRIIPELGPETWLRFLTSHPKDLSGELIDLIAATPALCRHVHLPVQHGSDRILQAMGRGYRRADYLALVERMRKTIPEVSLTTDILIGFPGERGEDFRSTLELMREVRFADAFTYRYNPREGTRAFAMEDDVPEAAKQERLSTVIELQRSITREIKKNRLGGEVKVLVQGRSKKNASELLARSEWDDSVVFPGPADWIGTFRFVRLTAVGGSTLRAEIQERDPAGRASGDYR